MNVAFLNGTYQPLEEARINLNNGKQMEVADLPHRILEREAESKKRQSWHDNARRAVQAREAE